MNLSEQLTALEAAYSDFIRSGRLVRLNELVGMSDALKIMIQMRAKQLSSLANSIQSRLSHIKLHSSSPVAEATDDQIKFYTDVYSKDQAQIDSLASDYPELLVDLEELFSDIDIESLEIQKSVQDESQFEASRLLNAFIQEIEEAEDSEFETSGALGTEGYDEELLEQAEVLIASKFFKPESYIRRVEQIRVVAADRAESEFPGYVRERMREVAETYICGQLISAIAGSRALLEFAIADRAKVIGFTPYQDENDDRLIGLDAMIVELTKLRPELRKKLEKIQKEGNEVLHPPRSKKVRKLLPSENVSLDCVNGVFEIISELYSKK